MTTDRLSDEWLQGICEDEDAWPSCDEAHEMANELIALRAENERLREAMADVRAVFLKLHELWDSDRDVLAGKLVIACLDASIHYNPLASRVAAAIAVQGGASR